MAIGEFLTTRDVAEKLGITMGRVHQFVTAGRLVPADRVGSVLVFRRKNVEEFAKRDRKPGRPKK